jgi:hypothetical protein
MSARSDDLRFLLALTRHSTLTAAAASLAVSQMPGPGSRPVSPPKSPSHPV